MKKDMYFDCEDGVLNIRAGAIIMRGKEVLMVGTERANHFHTIGCRTRFGETAEDAIVREVFEETGVKLEVDRLGFVQESYFYGDTLPDIWKLNYEISFFFFMKVPEDFYPIDESFTDETGREVLQWISLDENVQMYPDFLKAELQHPTDTVKHFVRDERVQKGEQLSTLKAKRLAFRNVLKSDEDRIFDYCSDKARAMQRWSQLYKSLCESIEAHLNDIFTDKETFMVAITEIDKDEMIGEITVTPVEHSFMLSCAIRYPFQRKGYAFEAMTAMINSLRGRYPSRDFVSLIPPDNAPAIALFTKLGFHNAGYLSDQNCHIFAKWLTPVAEALIAYKTGANLSLYRRSLMCRSPAFYTPPEVKKLKKRKNNFTI